ncbi:hypothetical protein BGZ73_003490 [Actinomortierella ambigua]|nr:hypothetical protein BGZ73_003490 [Actinomortierella ambigua]
MRFSLAALSTMALAWVASATSLTGPRALVLLDSLDDADSYSVLWKDLEERQYRLSLDEISSEVQLTKNDERNYDHLVMLTPNLKTYPKGLSAKSIIEFVASGGNLLIAGSPEMSTPMRELAREFDVEFDAKHTTVMDHFHYDQQLGSEKHDALLIPGSTNVLKNDRIIPAAQVADQSILFRGIAHSVNPSNQLLIPVLWASPEAYSWDAASLDEPAKQGTTPLLAGKDISLVSVMQARNNARIAFVGSTEMLSDRFFNAQLTPSGAGSEKATIKNGNRAFMEELTKWTFQEKGVIEVRNVHHTKVGEDDAPAHYRIKENMTYTIEMSEYHDDEWYPFVADDVQLELIMLDPYIRKTLERAEVDEASTLGVYSTTVQLPDHYGVFKFTVNYKRPGLSYIESVTTVGIHPYRHDQYPRFISQAKPYYTSAASMGIGFLVFSFVYLWGGLESSAKTTKKA